ncbi:SixA phosphatase family protein [Parasulfitobacter algicola]|uniref:Histidine phosphatase family protein n=1 Tax=Parasulfitobacter algicola TaxID=2614809 RepID=A0ABX2ISY2_9RHOB|nr:histidine phosphatase family protein [Sulfitobacter algicola]NSX56022.1 histidine phosphatase family protein [Sulfitobacter algicola]
MKRLILIRHAKSDWGTPGLTDHDRPLNNRGIRSAKAIGDWLRKQSYNPDQAISSSAQRTQDTWEYLAFKAPVQFTRMLYHADRDQMLKALRQATEYCVLMLGHNPGVAEFAESLVSDPPNDDRFFTYPTCATLIADFDIASWSDVSWGKAIAQDFVGPRDLL